MASTTLFLCRKNGRFFKYDSVEAVSLTGAITAYASVTGASATNIVTITGATLADGQQITLTQKTGGSGVVTNRVYFARDSSGSTCKLANTIGGTAVALGTDISAGVAIIQTDEIRVWSSEFRDIFTYSSETNITVGGSSAGQLTSGGVSILPEGVVATVPTGGASINLPLFSTVTGLTTNVSDEVAHAPLRQTFLPRTHWKFDMGASVEPRYLYAEWQTGDAVAPNPPNTI